MEAADWDERYRSQEVVWSIEPNRFVAEEASSLPAGRALDVAAGEGRNAIWLATQGWRVTAVDFSEVGLAKGRRLAEDAGVADRVDWEQADLRLWKSPGPDFDLVVVAYLQMPAEALAKVLTEAAASLRPGGSVIVVGHDRANIAGGVGGPQDPAVLYTAEGLRAILTTAGLEDVRAATVERPTPAGTALDTLATARRPGGGEK